MATHCQECLAFQSRWQGSIRLHCQTTEQLATAEQALVNKTREIRELEGQLLELVTTVRFLGGNVPESVQVRLGAGFTNRGRGRGR
jgi:hypothetical protein